jgi:hypothetical protein
VRFGGIGIRHHVGAACSTQQAGSKSSSPAALIEPAAKIMVIEPVFEADFEDNAREAEPARIGLCWISGTEVWSNSPSNRKTTAFSHFQQWQKTLSRPIPYEESCRGFAASTKTAVSSHSGRST